MSQSDIYPTVITIYQPPSQLALSCCVIKLLRIVLHKCKAAQDCGSQPMHGVASARAQAGKVRGLMECGRMSFAGMLCLACSEGCRATLQDTGLRMSNLKRDLVLLAVLSAGNGRFSFCTPSRFSLRLLHSCAELHTATKPLAGVPSLCSVSKGGLSLRPV